MSEPEGDPDARRVLKSDVLDPAELAQLQAHEDLRAERARRAARIEKRRARPARDAKAKAIRGRRANDAREAAVLRRREHKGPNLPAHLMRNARVNVVSSDLEEIPDGLYQRHAAEFDLRAMALGGGVTGPGAALLALLVVFWECKPKGTALQLPVDVLARKIGCARSWAYEQLERLQAIGLVGHRRRTRRYLHLAKELGLAGCFVGAGGELVHHKRWEDRGGVLREFVDVVAVTYATRLGVRRYRALERGRRLELEHGALTELWQQTQARRSALKTRLATAPEPDRTPYAVTPSRDLQLSTPGRACARDTGPPGPDVESASRTDQKNRMRSLR